jgi:hypothetical protein
MTRAPLAGGVNPGPQAASAAVIVAAQFSLRVIFGRCSASSQAV